MAIPTDARTCSCVVLLGPSLRCKTPWLKLYEPSFSIVLLQDLMLICTTRLVRSARVMLLPCPRFRRHAL